MARNFPKSRKFRCAKSRKKIPVSYKYSVLFCETSIFSLNMRCTWLSLSLFLELPPRLTSSRKVLMKPICLPPCQTVTIFVTRVHGISLAFDTVCLSVNLESQRYEGLLLVCFSYAYHMIRWTELGLSVCFSVTKILMLSTLISRSVHSHDRQRRQRR